MQKLNDLGRSLTPLESDCTLTVQRYHRAENSSGKLHKRSVGMPRMSWARASWLAISANRRGEPLPFVPAPALTDL
jgi:hypothetical protein